MSLEWKDPAERPTLRVIKKPEFIPVDNGVSETRFPLQDNASAYSMKEAADLHRRRIRRFHHLGFRDHIQACSNCGYMICRCADRERRKEIEAKRRRWQ
ncbi:hypothetical protein [Methanolobus chelungpuianus]|uniref:Uncharacterized protein n=1 Tax=Methanolobus chelungpuianus TaxID=502115 RepID=A0AAE3KXG2_9EURY|nr:hypothetical protein [Methanolobus chelungpuianus]MCQ6962782.1 hypothetical protein [Methanolobus chelungpuianus]